MTAWKDVTGYSQGQRGQIEPTAWKADFGDNVTVSITCGHIYHRPKWVMHCPALSMDTVPLGMTAGDDLDAVKAHVVNLAKRRAAVVLAALRAGQ